VSTILEELRAPIAAAQIERHGRTWPAPLEYWKAALEQMVQLRDQAKLQLPLKSHGYLLEVIAGMSDKAEAKAESAQERAAARARPRHKPASFARRARAEAPVAADPRERAAEVREGKPRMSQFALDPKTAVLDASGNHIGAANGITAKDLAAAIGMNEREVRHQVSALREEGIAVCGHPKTGYFIAPTPRSSRRRRVPALARDAQPAPGVAAHEDPAARPSRPAEVEDLNGGTMATFPRSTPAPRLAKAADDEPIFVLRASDSLAEETCATGPRMRS
jgi:biotin operon repressor